MDLLLLLVLLLASLFFFILHGYLAPRRNGSQVPEAAGAWPIIGHLHLLAGSQVAHKVLGSMADKFGPIFSIKLGRQRVLIVSNPEMAKECLTTNDKVFASRPMGMATELMGSANFGLEPYGPYWREIRKIVVLELMSHHRLKMLAHIRDSEVKSSMIDMYRTWVKKKDSSKQVMVDMKQWFGDLVMNMVLKIIFGNRFSQSEKSEDQFRIAIRQFVELLGAFVPSDAISGLRWLDLGGYEKKMKKTANELDVYINGLLLEHQKEMNSTQQGDESKDQSFMASLFSRVKELKEDLYGFSTDVIVKATCLSIFAAATDTTIATLTWALTLLVNNPVMLKRALEELENHVGRDRQVEESDLKNLVYLEAIIRETLRLYPTLPLSIPHESTEDCIVGGYLVPKGTRLLVNIWKIHHNPQIWNDPFEFQPERFLTSKKEIDVKGQHFELIPFGSGRRMCVGISFALEALQMILAKVLHGFEFQNPSNDQIDMTESPGLTNPKATSLELLVAPRLSPHVYGISI